MKIVKRLAEKKVFSRMLNFREKDGCDHAIVKELNKS